MIDTVPGIDNLSLTVTQEIHVRASLGKPLPMTIEPWPGGRWFRDLGDRNGHFWGHVQAIKRPTLLEITGPLFMSYPALSNLQYRLTEVDGGTLISFRHTAFGFIQDDHRQGLGAGWAALLNRIHARAEKR
jgi:uncharacterized protein YndB with AHSA1/START domain